MYINTLILVKAKSPLEVIFSWYGIHAKNLAFYSRKIYNIVVSESSNYNSLIYIGILKQYVYYTWYVYISLVIISHLKFLVKQKMYYIYNGVRCAFMFVRCNYVFEY